MDRRYGLGHKPVMIFRELPQPKRADYRIAARRKQPRAVGIVDQQAGKTQERRSGGIQKKPERIAQYVFKSWPPAIAPEMLERCHDVSRDQRPVVWRYPLQGIERDRMR